MKKDKNVKNADAVGITFRLPKDTAEKMYAITDKSGKAAAAFITYAVEWYVAHLFGNEHDDKDSYEIDKFTANLIKNKG